MDTDLRASLYVALSLAVLSLLIGALAGVLFLPLITRAFIGGSLVGGIVYGALFLIRHYLPGLLPDHSQDARGSDSAFTADEGEPTTGSRVDIVLPGGDVEQGSEFTTDQSSAKGGDEIQSDIDGVDDDDVEEIRLIDTQDGEEEGAAVPVPPTPTHSASSMESLDDLDVLPDLDGFTDSFAAAEFSSSGAALPSSRAEEQSSPRVSDGLDPATLAKAVRTILKRDQKG